MSNAIRVPTPINASAAESEKSASHQLVAIGLFSGIGLLISLVAVILGASVVWS